MNKCRFRVALVCLLALAVFSLILAGGLGGCEKKKAGFWGGDEDGDQTTDGNGDQDTTEATGPSGIAFIRDDYIYLANEDGSGERKVTPEAAGYDCLAFSPSGSMLAATKVEGDAYPQLIIIDVESGEVTDVSWTNPDYSAAWTGAGIDPWFGEICWAGEDVLYCTATNTSAGMIPQVVKCDASARRIEVIEKNAQNPAISPDGKKLAYIRQPPDWWDPQGGWGYRDPGILVVRDLASGNTETISVNRDGYDRGYIFDAAFSPDGEHMVATCFDEPDTELYYTDLEGNIDYVLDAVGPAGIIMHPSFSPTGDKVVFHIRYMEEPDQPYDYTIFIAPVSGQNMPDVSELSKGMDPTWSPSP